MPKATPQWKKKMPEFLGAIEGATEEKHIQKACEEIKKAVVDSYPLVPASRKKPMTEIRKAIMGCYPTQEGKSEHESAPFPYVFMKDGYKKGKGDRWEHLAIEYLEADWDRKEDRSFEVVKPEAESTSETENNNLAVVKAEETSMVDTKLDILGQVGLTAEELENVKAAIGDTDVIEWLKQAVLQRANTIISLRNRLDEDLSLVPSQTLIEDKKYRTNPVACRELTSRAVRAIKDFNRQSPEHRWCITNKLISEVTGNTVKAIAKAVEGMGLEDYNKMMDLQPVHNRLTKAAIGDIKDVVSIKDVLGVDG